MFQVERREQQATIGMDFKQWADEYFSENGGNLDRPIKQSEVLNRYLTETGNKLSMHSLTRKMKAYCNFATHIHCLNPASVTGRRKDGERFIKREGDQTLQYYYVESNRAIATDNTLGPEQSEFPF